MQVCLIPKLGSTQFANLPEGPLPIRSSITGGLRFWKVAEGWLDSENPVIDQMQEALRLCSTISRAIGMPRILESQGQSAART